MDAKPQHAMFQLASTLTLFLATVFIMWAGLSYTYWIAAILMLPAAGLLVRLFVIQHDCGHDSFFSSRAANTFTGRLLSVLTFTPYDCWRQTHNLHHAGSGNLDQRSAGSIDTLTVREYQDLSKANKLWYRLYRNPFIMIFFGAPYYNLIGQRFFAPKELPFNTSYRSVSFKRIWKSVMSLNLALLLFYGALGMLFGFKALLVIVLPVVVITSWIGCWLFFIQHQYETTYWEKSDDWDFSDAALQGSSYYVLPPVLQWFTGNIGLHHIHHLCAKVPNYRLQECLDDSPALKQMNRMTLRQSLECAFLALWDEDRRKMVTFADVR